MSTPAFGEMRPPPASLSGRIFAALAGAYRDRGALYDRAIEVYDAHLHEIPAGYGVERLLTVGVEEGWITKCADGSWLVVAGSTAIRRKRSR